LSAAPEKIFKKERKFKKHPILRPVSAIHNNTFTHILFSLLMPKPVTIKIKNGTVRVSR
jgi:hypothetical protein